MKLAGLSIGIFFDEAACSAASDAGEARTSTMIAAPEQRR